MPRGVYTRTEEWRENFRTSMSRPEVRAKLRKAHLGKPHSDSHRAAIKAGMTDQVRIRMSISAAKRIRKHQTDPTSLEFALDLLLQDAGLEYEAQKRFGRYVVDAYVPSRNLVFEADGMYWYHHQDKEREARRDAYLIDGHGVSAVIHLDDNDLSSWDIKCRNLR